LHGKGKGRVPLLDKRNRGMTQRFAAQTRRHSGGTRGTIKPEAVRIRLLGGFEASVGSQAIGGSRWRLKKAGSLVKLLALARGHRLHREQIMDVLWPDLDKRSQANNLHRILHFAREVLGATSGDAASLYLPLQDDLLVLCPDSPLWVDVDAFEDAGANARRVRDPAAYRLAVDLYAGELLPEDRYQAWAEERRAQLRELYLSLLLEMAALHEERGEYGQAIEVLRRALAEEPSHEEAHARLMRSLAFHGWSGEAILQYERLRRILSRELDADPSPATRHLYEEIRAGRLQAAPTPYTGRHAKEPPDYPSNNLPDALTSFVGREHETLEVKRRLSMTRLLTLAGTGGCGKTRLALEIARDLVETYPDGVWLAELAPLSKPDLAPQAVATALGVTEQAGRSLEDTLVDHLRSRDLLLVLDNCEHLVDGAARLAGALLGACPNLKVLATSREPLDVPGEAVWTVRPLSLPDADREATVEDLMRCEAVRLFVDRARSRLPAFELTPENAASTASVCLRLDGIPLAIELATARMGALAIEQVAQRLDDSLGLLTGGARTVDHRQQTLRGTLEWSYELLSEPERKLFGRLSVFSGGFTLAAAESVCAGEEIERGMVLDLLSRLVDKSLVLVVHQGVEARYRLLETIRQYGSEKLEQSGEAPEIGRRHAGFFLGLAERAEPELNGVRQEAWLDRLETEHDNLRAALRWSLEGEELETGLRLASALWQFCYTHGHYDDGREWLEGALVKGGPPTILRAKALTGAGILTFLQCEYERAGIMLEEGLAAYRDLGDKRGIAFALQSLGSIARERGHYDRAVALHEESLALQRGLGNEEGIARSLDGLGFVAWLRRDHQRAETLCAEALKLYRGLEDAEGVAWSLVNMGAAAQHRDDLGRAEELLNESLALSRRAGYKEGVAWSLNQLGLVEQRRGDHERATRLLHQSLEVHRDLGDRWRAASVLEGLVSSNRELGRREQAARLLGGAEALREAIGAPLPPCERLDHDRNVSALRAATDEAAFPRARGEGRAMSPEQAIEYALGTEEPHPRGAFQRAPDRLTDEMLTRREREVAALARRGLTNRQIATMLSISEHTAATHLHRILKKLGLRSRAQLSA
jgi:predicted ATPase/DNA-binding SARP family transcriptional activator/DNA-binding CsgD family transcriptional regulator